MKVYEYETVAGETGSVKATNAQHAEWQIMRNLRDWHYDTDDVRFKTIKTLKERVKP